jgi:hypothetical protein
VVVFVAIAVEFDRNDDDDEDAGGLPRDLSALCPLVLLVALYTW